MRLFRVDCYACGGAHRTFSKDQIMKETDFLSGQAQERVDSGHVVEVTEEEAKSFGYVPDGSTVSSKEEDDERIAQKLDELEAEIVKAKAAKKPKPETIAAAEKELADFKAGLN